MLGGSADGVIGRCGCRAELHPPYERSDGAPMWRAVLAFSRAVTRWIASGSALRQASRSLKPTKCGRTSISSAASPLVASVTAKRVYACCRNQSRTVVHCAKIMPLPAATLLSICSACKPVPRAIRFRSANCTSNSAGLWIHTVRHVPAFYAPDRPFCLQETVISSSHLVAELLYRIMAKIGKLSRDPTRRHSHRAISA